MKALWTLLYSLILIFPLTEAIGEENRDTKDSIYVTYPLSGTGENSSLVKELKPGEGLLPGNYNVKAKLFLKSEQVEVELESLNFEPLEGNSPPNKNLQQGWTYLDKTYYWNPKSRENALTIPLSSKFTDKPTSLTDFDELQLDFNDLIPENPSLLSIKMIVAREKPKKNQATVIIDRNQMVLLNSLNLPSALWKEKSFSYLAKRTFELPHDPPSWVFVKKKKYIFFQKRFHLNINNVDTIDIHFKPNTSLEKIDSLSCNLRIGFESLIFPTKIMECGWFPKKIFRSNGNLVLRIWTGKEFRSKFIKKKKAFLDEIIFRIAGKQLKSIQEQPVASIQFHTLKKTKLTKEDTAKKESTRLDIKDQTFHFQAPVTTLPSKRKRIVFPLKVLKNKIGRNNRIEHISLSIEPAHWDAPSKFLLQRLRLVSHGSKQYPKLLNVGEKLSARWGGPFFYPEKNSDEVEWIKVRDFFSFNGLNTNQKSKLTTFLKGARPVRSNTSTSIDFRGIQIHAQNGLQSWHADKDGLILKGKGNWVEIDWPLQTKLDKDTRFFMSFGTGKENILDLNIKPFGKNQKLRPLYVLPNESVRLKWKSKKVKRVKIKVFLRGSPFTLQLKEMVVFQPTLLKSPEIIDTPTLIAGETLLVPKNVKISPQEKVTIFKGHLSASFWPIKEGGPNELSWTTKVNKKVHRVQGLKFIYKVSATMHASNPCWLHFTLVSTNHKVNRTMCSEDSTSEIIFPAEQLFHGINFKNNEILKYISWKILAENQPNIENQPLPIDVAVSLIAYDVQTFRSDLLSHPVMEWNGMALFATSIERGVSKEDEIPYHYFTSLGKVSIKNKTQAPPIFNVLDHPHFISKKISLRKREAISADDWADLTNKKPQPILPIPEKKYLIDESQGSNYPRVIFFSLLVGCLWWGWKQKERIFSLKWLVQLSPELSQKQIRVWLFVAVGHYLFGLILSLLKWRSGADFFLTIAGLAVLMAWRSFIWKIRPDLELRNPEIATRVYLKASSPYITGFILTLVLAAFFLTISLKPVADQIAVVGYYMLIVGLVLEFKTLRKENQENKEKKNSIDTETGTTLA